MNKKQLYTGIGAIGLVGVLGMSVTSSAGFMGNQAATEALQNGDLDAFKAAVEVEGNERLQSKLDSLDEERFAELQERFNTKEAIKESIENEDYDAYQAAVAELDTEDEGRGHRGRNFVVDSEEEFLDLVERYNEKEATQLALTEAVNNDDREEFDAIIDERISDRIQDIDEEEGSQLNRRTIELSDEQRDELWENAQQAVEDGEEINLKSLFGGKNKRGRGGVSRVLRNRF